MAEQSSQRTGRRAREGHGDRRGEAGKAAARGGKCGVILAIGGFDHDGEKRRKYQSEALTADWSFGNPDNTGDLFEIARQVGAGLAAPGPGLVVPRDPLADSRRPLQSSCCPSVRCQGR